MPAGLVKTPRDERLWEKAKAQAAKEGKSGDWAYTTAIYKKMAGVSKARPKRMSVGDGVRGGTVMRRTASGNRVYASGPKRRNVDRSLTVPESVRNNAKRGLALRKEHGRGGLNAKQAKAEGSASGVATARALVAGKVGPLLVARMHRFFSRHSAFKKYHSDKSSAAYISWMLWGGDSGASWAKSIARRMKVKKGWARDTAGRKVVTADFNASQTRRYFTSGKGGLTDAQGNKVAVRRSADDFRRSRDVKVDLKSMLGASVHAMQMAANGLAHNKSVAHMQALAKAAKSGDANAAMVYGKAVIAHKQGDYKMVAKFHDEFMGGSPSMKKSQDAADVTKSRGEGAKGGVVTGHTTTGKPIYAKRPKLIGGKLKTGKKAEGADDKKKHKKPKHEGASGGGTAAPSTKGDRAGGGGLNTHDTIGAAAAAATGSYKKAKKPKGVGKALARTAKAVEVLKGAPVDDTLDAFIADAAPAPAPVEKADNTGLTDFIRVVHKAQSDYDMATVDAFLRSHMARVKHAGYGEYKGMDDDQRCQRGVDSLLMDCANGYSKAGPLIKKFVKDQGLDGLKRRAKQMYDMVPSPAEESARKTEGEPMQFFGANGLTF